MKKETTISVLKDIRALLKANNTFLAQMAIKKPIEQNIAKELGVNTNISDKYFKIVDGPGKKTSDLLNECKAKFQVSLYYDDAKLDVDFPAPKDETIRLFKKVIEADEENVNKSANDLKDQAGITLRERLIMELQYFSETKQHLDIINWTLCSGSRHSDGGVPGVRWDPTDRKLQVLWHYVDSRRSSLRSRVAVLNPSDF